MLILPKCVSAGTMIHTTHFGVILTLFLNGLRQNSKHKATALSLSFLMEVVSYNFDPYSAMYVKNTIAATFSVPCLVI